MMTRRIFTMAVATVLATLLAHGQSTHTPQEARRLFDKVYTMVFGPEGSTLHYDVNIVGVMSTSGTIWYKGKKKRFSESRYSSWNDGVDDYWVDEKKKTVTHYTASDPHNDKYMSKFTFHPDDYRYSIDKSNSGLYILTIDAKKGVKGIKHMKAELDRKTLVPKNLKIKVLWFWTTVRITRFKSGGISDSVFTFPAERYKSYKRVSPSKQKK